MVPGIGVPCREMPRERKLTLIPVSQKAKRFGDRPRNVLVEMEREGRMFVRFEGWNHWTWVAKKGDPHYRVKRGWSDSGFPLPINRVSPRD